MVSLTGFLWKKEKKSGAIDPGEESEMRRFSYQGQWMLEQLSGPFSVVKEDIAGDARLKKGPFVLETESYRVEGVGHYCILRMNALFGLMKMETLVLAATERDLPLLNLDRVCAMGKDTQIAELYDTQLQPWPEEEQAAFQALRERDADLAEPEKKGERWFDSLLYPCSYHKTGKKCARRLDRTAQEYACAFLACLNAAPPCDPKAKKEKVRAFAGTLFERGGPAVDMVTKLFGPEIARRLILHHMYGV